jgi:hypothetical protein
MPGEETVLNPSGIAKMRKGRLLLLKCSLLGCAVLLAFLDIRLAGSHLARSFVLFRKPHQAFPVFTFGVSFWSFFLGLPLALIPFKKLTYKHRYLLCSLFFVILLLLMYLVVFLYRMIRD